MKKIKILNSKEVDDLIEGIGNGDIIIDGRNSKPMTPEEVEEFRKIRKEHYDALSAEEKEEIEAFAEKLRKEDNESTGN